MGITSGWLSSSANFVLMVAIYQFLGTHAAIWWAIPVSGVSLQLWLSKGSPLPPSPGLNSHVPQPTSALSPAFSNGTLGRSTSTSSFVANTLTSPSLLTLILLLPLPFFIPPPYFGLSSMVTLTWTSLPMCLTPTGFKPRWTTCMGCNEGIDVDQCTHTCLLHLGFCPSWSHISSM